MSVMREGRRRKLQEKLMQRDGMILPIVLLSIAVIASTILFVVIPGYQEHLRNARIQADVQSVATARDVASITYLQDRGGQSEQCDRCKRCAEFWRRKWRIASCDYGCRW